MQSSQPHTARSVLEAFYDAERKFLETPVSERNFSTIATVLSPDFVMEQTSGLPYAGTYKGVEGMQTWMEAMAKWFSSLDLRDREIFEKPGSERIMVSSNCMYRVRATGKEVVAPLAQTITVDVANGHIKEIRPFYWDVYALNKELGYEPKK